MSDTPAPPPLELGRSPLRVEEVVQVARGRRALRLDPDGPVARRLDAGAARLAERLGEGARVYGVSTGFGHQVTNAVPLEASEALARNLVRFHGSGVGPPLGPDETAAVVAVRLATLARGQSGVRSVVALRLLDLLERRLLPVVPSLGSVGASGDLTPLSYVAAALAGERTVLRDGVEVPAADALRDAGLDPVALRPREALALMNGTSVMTGLGCLAWDRALRLTRLGAALSAMLTDAVRGHAGQFDARIFEAKPHPGQRAVAAWIRADLEGGPSATRGADHLQDRYSIRCAPHVLGVLADHLLTARAILETELNGASDNPLLDLETGDVLHGGNFYGGHVGFVLDGLKVAVASVADLLDRQVLTLCHPDQNGGLPPNLVAGSGPDRAAHHGFKALSITCSALAAECQKRAIPATLFSRSTENHNQDKVPMGTHAALDALAILDLAETIAAIATLALAQAVDLRGEASERGRAIHEAVRRVSPAVEADRATDADIATVLDLHRRGELPAGAAELP